MYQHLQFHYKGDWDFDIQESGYTPVKLTQLKTYYMPPQNLDHAMSLMSTRIDKNKYGSVLIPHQGRMKTGFTQNDYCMIGTTLTYYPKESTITWCTHWRSTEAIKRCRGDFLLIRYMIDALQGLFDRAPLTEFTFKFDTLTLHPMMVPLAFPYWKWRKWLQAIESHNPVLHRDIVRWLIYYFDNPERSYERYSSAHQVHKIAHRQLSNREVKAITRYAQKYNDGGARG